jgi:hypothetical protein
LVDFVFEILMLLPALSFMLWVIWALEKQMRLEKRRHDAMVSGKR